MKVTDEVHDNQTFLKKEMRFETFLAENSCKFRTKLVAKLNLCVQDFSSLFKTINRLTEHRNVVVVVLSRRGSVHIDGRVDVTWPALNISNNIVSFVLSRSATIKKRLKPIHSFLNPIE